MGQVYIVGKLEGHYKIGRSINADDRVGSFSPLLPVPMSFMHKITTPDEIWLERVFHIAFQHCRGGGEWFKLTDADIELLLSVHHIENLGHLPLPIAEAWASRPRSSMGDEVRRLRVEAGLSQSELAKKLGISQPALARTELGGGISAKTLFRLCDAFNLDCGYFRPFVKLRSRVSNTPKGKRK